MKGLNFPIFKTKVDGVTKKFKLEDPAERRKYFGAKAGKEIEQLRGYLDAGNTFVGFLLGPKISGKGTYTKLFMEAVGIEHVAHISVGDIVRSVHKDLLDEARKKELVFFLEKRYRGFITIEKAIEIILGRDTKTLLPTEIILAFVEREIDRLGRKAVFIDGFPRDLDQVSFSLYFRALMGYRDDPDFFIFIDVPESVIDERIKYRVACPLCQTPRNTRLLRTKDVCYEVSEKKFYLLCDNPNCDGYGQSRMVAKEGDAFGIEPLRNRIEMDAQVVRKLVDLHGIPKVYLRNSVPVDVVKEYVDDYEITPAYSYEWDEKLKAVNVIEEPWTIEDDEGKQSYSLLPASVALAFIKQTASALNL